MAKITYENKEDLISKEEVADVNKVTAYDLNEIKSVVNDNDNFMTKIKNYISANPIGEIVLWNGDQPITGDNNYVTLGVFYAFKTALEARYPIKDNCTRKAKLCLDYNDGSLGGYITVRLEQGNFLPEFNFAGVWGNATSGTKATGTVDFNNFSNLPSGHITIKVKSDIGPTRYVRLYKVYLLIYDEII